MHSIDFGLLAVRLLIGGLFVGHGAVKFTERFRGLGLDGATRAFERFGYQPARTFTIVAGITEIAAGVAFAVGIATPLAVAAIVGVMLNSIRTALAGKGLWYFNGGWEYNLSLLWVAAALAFIGPGDASLDAWFGWDLAGWAWGTGAVLAGLASGAATLGLRRSLAASPAAREAAI